MFYRKLQFFAVLSIICNISFTPLKALDENHPIYGNAKNIYKELQKESPFVVSCGISCSQTGQSNNTMHPAYLGQLLQNLANKAKDRFAFLNHPNHIGYTLHSLPSYQCTACGLKIDSHTKFSTEYKSKIISDIAKCSNSSHIAISSCPICHQEIEEFLSDECTFDQTHQDAMICQLKHLGILDTDTANDLPTFRLSLEVADILQEDGKTIDLEKLKEQSSFIKNLKNPFLFCHHYTNPAHNSHLFENAQDADWFAQCCATIAKTHPEITHMCPISQPVGFAQRVSRATLPPFQVTINFDQYLKNITEAQIKAAKAIKAVSCAKKVFISHQWKLFKPMHAWYNGWYALECLVCNIADRLYNQKFVSMLKSCEDDFDGIALSVYPALKFNGWIPQGDNCGDSFNHEDALNTIMAVHKAFPKKEIIIVETGCNTTDPQKKIDFINMMLYVCKQAKDKGVKLSGIYFWGLTNDPEYYYEWNMAPGSTNFGPYDKLDPKNPIDSINAAGIFLKEIIEQKR